MVVVVFSTDSVAFGNGNVFATVILPIVEAGVTIASAVVPDTALIGRIGLAELLADAKVDSSGELDSMVEVMMFTFPTDVLIVGWLMFVLKVTPAKIPLADEQTAVLNDDVMVLYAGGGIE